MQTNTGNTLWLRLAAVVAVAFGLLTIKEGGTILFGDEAARAAAGNYVPFVLWFNFMAGFAYVIAGAIILKTTFSLKGLWKAAVELNGQILQP